MDKLIIIGAGGHCRSVVDSLDKTKFELIGFIDGHKKGTHMDLPIFSDKIEDIENYKSYKYFVAIGDAYFRKKRFEEIKSKGLETINIIDKTAIVSKTVKMGEGNYIGKLAVINAYAELGDNNIINTKALVEHCCKIGSHNHISTNATINGDVILGDEIFFGSCAVSNGQLKIGSRSVIGSGSVVIKDIESDVTAVGVPAKVIKRRSLNEQN